ncbi:MAG: hypothetical protein LC798_12775 [Chloroflexi bacterium]|nr:hypothetical protein [Chloroflexota bacterium]
MSPPTTQEAEMTQSWQAQIAEALAAERAATVQCGARAAAIAAGEIEAPAPHDCDEQAVPYESEGALGHGFECGACGAFLQAG